MKRFIAVALLASFVCLAFTDTADARCRRRRSCCQQSYGCQQGGCMPAQAGTGAWQDPQAMNQQYGQPGYNQAAPGQPQYGQPQYGQPTPANTFYRGNMNAQQPMPPAPTTFNDGTQGAQNLNSNIQGSASPQGVSGSVQAPGGSAQGSAGTQGASGSARGSAQGTSGSVQGSSNTNP